METIDQLRRIGHQIKLSSEEAKKFRAKLAEIVTAKFGKITEKPIEFLSGTTVVSIKKANNDYTVLFRDLDQLDETDLSL